MPLRPPLTSPRAQSCTKSLLISNQAFDSGKASLKSQLSSMVWGGWRVEGIWVALCGALCWFHLSMTGVTLNKSLNFSELQSLSWLNGDLREKKKKKSTRIYLPHRALLKTK